MALLVALASIVPYDDVVRDSVDVIELNRMYDDQARHVFDQYIFYEWDVAAERYQVVAWRVAKSASQVPARDWQRGGYVATWHDSQTGNLLRSVRSISFRETWTQYDPEILERGVLSHDLRRGLKGQ